MPSARQAKIIRIAAYVSGQGRRWTQPAAGRRALPYCSRRAPCCPRRRIAGLQPRRAENSRPRSLSRGWQCRSEPLSPIDRAPAAAGTMPWPPPPASSRLARRCCSREPGNQDVARATSRSSPSRRTSATAARINSVDVSISATTSRSCHWRRPRRANWIRNCSPLYAQRTPESSVARAATACLRSPRARWQSIAVP